VRRPAGRETAVFRGGAVASAARRERRDTGRLPICQVNV